ncbi:MAG: aminotransferase DegT [Omnitrophica WOR_2 bacterium GWF2_38_59]|nr:MAG: aminotransferase DegT [Omnitrophica WOR_2 bacterium GWA2_37_7]OGX26003.1 MAG: aminotransferase DegT [Omnitrophica WOR_2 bacterium GWF2_38_59]OGX48875.1 MAG: aminotransferase DegT [Omnitrophica WOR_2 bacterium RIFOXYA2_FULL_38_17]OGX52742.1 MAG: aminotransferase DegT [Omnitrophica WOR_2 bacterium RIFOXYA12_FULL_38_10]OGX56849.1 MAG: aminotransferase DegT [Omnitrophica WOR_2 bacterium RIFOXYB2_FULL_38_16]OGX57604.1 MAG: aminotransferase DegT [Omnitrophica WOR_2 bacterium RIFOXYC2_FULL_38
MKIPITKPIFDEHEKDLLVKPLESGWLVQGPYVKEFEKLFSIFTGAKYSCTTSNCTTALHLALEALGICHGDKVIIPSFTYIASANAVEYTGAEAIFCDIDLRTFNINIDDLSNLLEKDRSGSIKAIMPVNLFGLCSNLPKIIELAKHYNLKIVEDSACGLGSYIGDQHSGTFGDIGCFSFHPRKLITTGEGGMLTTEDESLLNKFICLKDHGASKSDLQRHQEKGGSLLPEFNVRGFNYRMTDMQGALGVAQMNKLSFILEGRRRIAAKYDIALENSPLLTPIVPKNYKHSYQSYVCLYNKSLDLDNLTLDKINELNIKRNQLMSDLENVGISVRQGTHAVHTLGFYKNKYDFSDNTFLKSYTADRLSITLPLYANMTDAEFDYVISNINNLIS